MNEMTDRFILEIDTDRNSGYIARIVSELLENDSATKQIRVSKIVREVDMQSVKLFLLRQEFDTYKAEQERIFVENQRISLDHQAYVGRLLAKIAELEKK